MCIDKVARSSNVPQQKAMKSSNPPASLKHQLKTDVDTTGVALQIKRGVDKNKILDEYMARYGPETISKRQGKRIINFKLTPPSNASLIRKSKMKPALDQ